MRHPKLFAGPGHQGLALAIANNLGVELGHCVFEKFHDGEECPQLLDVHGQDVFLIQPTHQPTDHLFQLLQMIDAAKRSAAMRITVVIPYFGWARQDRKDKRGVPITARLVVDMLQVAGAKRILTMDLHAPQIQGFSSRAVDHLYGRILFAERIKQMNIPDLVVVAPDVGGDKMAQAYARRLK